MRAPFSCESMACLSFMRLPLPADLSGLAMHFCYLILTFCGVGDSGSSFFAFRFLLGLCLAWAQALSSSIQPLFPFIVGL